MNIEDKEAGDKNGAELIDDVDVVVASLNDPSNFTDFTRKEHKKVIRKIDLRLVTGLGLLMGICLMDRTNLGSTAIAGYALCLSSSRFIASCFCCMAFAGSYNRGVKLITYLKHE
ncbi:hypothetical protein PHISCL_01995 [Aspergillus sclerotialis]|uniref:Uncharacterized protein n=1 Tax=Aspergillus sclerotialis TaxID=2070753 RepID=A0A3A2ZR85_9EURO|nr:hypothetical protein PHISCL_01995 [Aspergillus sclerotialis]